MAPEPSASNLSKTGRSAERSLASSTPAGGGVAASEPALSGGGADTMKKKEPQITTLGESQWRVEGKTATRARATMWRARALECYDARW